MLVGDTADNKALPTSRNFEQLPFGRNQKTERVPEAPATQKYFHSSFGRSTVARKSGGGPSPDAAAAVAAAIRTKAT